MDTSPDLLPQAASDAFRLGYGFLPFDPEPTRSERFEPFEAMSSPLAYQIGLAKGLREQLLAGTSPQERSERLAEYFRLHMAHAKHCMSSYRLALACAVALRKIYPESLAVDLREPSAGRVWLENSKTIGKGLGLKTKELCLWFRYAFESEPCSLDMRFGNFAEASRNSARGAEALCLSALDSLAEKLLLQKLCPQPAPISAKARRI